MRDIFATDVFIPTKKMSIYEAIKDVQTALILRQKCYFHWQIYRVEFESRSQPSQSQNGLPRRLRYSRKGPAQGEGLGSLGGAASPPLFEKWINKFKYNGTSIYVRYDEVR